MEDFDKYYFKTFSEDEIKNFEFKLANDEKLLEDYQNYLLSIEAIKYNSIREIVKKVSERKKSHHFILSFKRLSVAASVILSFFLGLKILTINNTSEYLIKKNTPLYALTVYRDTVRNFTEIEKAYLIKDYEKVINLSQESDKSDSKTHFLKGVSHFNLGHYQKTIEEINNQKRLFGSQYYMYAQENDLYEIMSLIGNKEISNAIKKINDLPKNHKYRDIYDLKFKVKLFALLIFDEKQKSKAQKR